MFSQIIKNVGKFSDCSQQNISQNNYFEMIIQEILQINSQKLIDLNSRQILNVYKNKTLGYWNIYKDNQNKFSIGVFVISKDQCLPLHDHPQMTVFTKVLQGKLLMKSIDFENKQVQIDHPQDIYVNHKFHLINQNQVYQGSKLTEQILKSDEVVYLHQKYRNLHSIHALENTAFLDILLPDYDFKNRFCNFYQLVSHSENQSTFKYSYQPPDYECETIDQIIDTNILY